ncbi:TolB family protein [Sphingomonas sp.]|uniref:TolB family protein n=1 Tax=Sphingomonas sp. TaxID=28214 RepID=UPI003B003C2F
MLALALLLAISATIDRGNVVVHDGPATRTITIGGGFSEPVVSPDGRQVAFLHADSSVEDEERTSLWVAATAGAPPRRLVAPRESREPERNLARFGNLHWSLDGRFVYLDANAWATSEAIHQIDVRTGAERYIVDGWNLGVIRTGPWRGYLLVGQHRYYHRVEGGSYNPVALIRPDGHTMFRIPGSAEDDGEQSVPRWLRAHRWTAS